MSKIDLEKEEKILRKIHRDMILDQNTDIDKEASYFTEDAFVIPPNGSPIIGADNLKKVCEEMVKTEVISKSGGPTRVKISKSGDLAYDMGNYRLVNKGDKGPVTEEGYFLTIYRKVGGKWKFEGQIWNNLASQQLK